MNASDLRIGNWIEIDGIAYPTNASDITAIEQGMKANPIPLNEEWLLKFGFESNKYHDEFEIIVGNDIILLDCEYTDRGVFNFIINDTCLTIDIKQVHQLQNVCHALTNEELTIKEKTYTLPKVDKSKVEKYDRT